MKRSEINAVMRESLDLMARMGFHLPTFALWRPHDWRTKGPECRDIVSHQLGWDITDFGSGDFRRIGLFLFTIRNGHLGTLSKDPAAKSYCEKILIARPDQLTPNHYHELKMEDIINRGGGDLVLRFHRVESSGGLGNGDLELSLDGVRRRIEAGQRVVLAPGESVTIPQRVYHDFWAEGEETLIGEVSKVNDDHTDNMFLDPVGRFPDIEEDEEPLHLLVGDYRRYYAGG